MCFSAGASFTASAFLSLSSVATLSRAQKKSSFIIAATPLLFAMQQFAEGIVWLSFSNPAFVPFRTIASYVFLAFAFVIWPIWMPLALGIAETNSKRKYLFIIPLLAGICIAFYLLTNLITYGVITNASNCHIGYQLNIPEYIWTISMFIYLIATALPFFLSSIKKVWILGLALIFSYLVAYFFYYYVLISVWCFFAAILSILIFSILPLPKKSGR